MLTKIALSEVSSISLTVLLIILLMIVELGNPRWKKALLPFIAVLVLMFLIVAVMSIINTYNSLG